MIEMRHRGTWMVVAIVLVASIHLCAQQRKTPQGDALLREVLTRIVAAGGGAEALSSVHDITETGAVTFHWAEEVKGAVVIRLLGGNHFRMEVDIPEGKRTWIVKDGVGTVAEAGGAIQPLSYDNALNLGNLTFPLAHVVAAMVDSRTDVTLVGTETVGERSVYRLRLKGQLGLHNQRTGTNLPIAKDLLVDALTFDIVSVEDRPFQTYRRDRNLSDKPSRVIEFGDFRIVNGIRVPFLITTQLMGQKTITIQLSDVAFNSNLRVQDFEN